VVQREIKFHNVTPAQLDALKIGIAAKYPDTGDIGEGKIIDVGHGYTLFWRYVGTDLVVSVHGGEFFMSKAASMIATLVLESIGPQALDGAA
jgi:hypothetical protein